MSGLVDSITRLGGSHGAPCIAIWDVPESFLVAVRAHPNTVHLVSRACIVVRSHCLSAAPTELCIKQDVFRFPRDIVAMQFYNGPDEMTPTLVVTTGDFLMWDIDISSREHQAFYEKDM